LVSKLFKSERAERGRGGVFAPKKNPFFPNSDVYLEDADSSTNMTNICSMRTKTNSSIH